MNHKKEMQRIEKESIDSYSFTCIWSPAINKTYPLGYKNNDDPIFSIVWRGIPSRKVVNELLKTYPANTFNFEYLEHYWTYNGDLE